MIELGEKALASVTDGALIVLVLLVWEAIRYGLGRFMKKAVETEYVTREEFDNHKTHCVNQQRSDRRELLSAIDDLRRVSTNMEALVMELAIKADIPAHEVIKRLPRQQER